jgi:hypothetical protein
VDIGGGRVMALTTEATAAPGLINYQGRLTNASGQPITTPIQVTFTFWDEPAMHPVDGRMWTASFNKGFEAKYGFSPMKYYPALWYDIGPETQAAHTYDTKLRFNGTANPLTSPYTCGSGTTLLVLGIVTPVNFTRPGGAPTYNGVAMTQAFTPQGASNIAVEMWYLANPAR